MLIVRDMMVRGLRAFKDFQQSGEGIATNILADRLKKLEAAGILAPKPEQADRRRVTYRLTEKGIDLAPVMLELLIWGARHEHTAAPCAVIDQMEKIRGEILAETRRRWAEDDRTPLLPKFQLRSAEAPKLRTAAGKRNSRESFAIRTRRMRRR